MIEHRPETNPGSFRDPGGFVFDYEGRLFRAIRAPATEHFEKLAAADVFSELQADGSMVRSTRVDGPLLADLKVRFPEADVFLEHDRVPFVNYPAEWTPAMLADAAALHVDVQIRLMDRGFSLKDGSAYNVQFRGGRPVFIDVLSIEAQKQPLWRGYGQFCRHFLFPLALRRHARQDLRGYFLSHIDGLDVADVVSRLGWSACMHPSLLVDLTLQNLLQKAFGAKPLEAAKAASGRGLSVEAQRINLRRLRGLVQDYAAGRALESRWSAYATAGSYPEEAAARKRAFVARFLERARPKSVLDLGCNTGEFSRMAVQSGAQAVAVDGDEACADRLYRRTRAEGSAILPLVVDLANPTPAFGFESRERTAFLERMPCEAVLALALTHHLLVVSCATLPMIRDLLDRLARRHLLVEWVGPTDEQFRSLVGLRGEDYSHFTESRFESAFAERFGLVSKEKLSDCRTLFHFARP